MKTKKLFFIPIIVLFATFFISADYKDRKIIQNEMYDINEQIEEVNREIEQLEAVIEYSEDDEFVEEVARNKLGLVKDNDIIFRDYNSKE